MAQTLADVESSVLDGNVVFPPTERITVEVPEEIKTEFDALIHRMGWTREEGIKILLAYGADTLTRAERSPDEVYNEWAAARAEMAVLRHRAYVAAEAIRSLSLNITGLTASNSQYQRSLAVQRARRDRLRRAVADLEAQARRP
ncbi:MAG: hypothetical protein QN178_01895 [Armatimonadota bacterium]|nr:hypothetical protein [Armatimonadota bacterium]